MIGNVQGNQKADYKENLNSTRTLPAYGKSTTHELGIASEETTVVDSKVKTTTEQRGHIYF